MAGDLQAQAEFEAAYPELVTVADRAIRRFFRYDATDVEVVVAEAMARAFADWERIRTKGKHNMRVLECAKRVCLEHIRRDAQRLERAAADSEDGNRGLDPTDTASLSASISLSLERLPTRQRDVAVVHYLMDCDEETTAAALGTTVAKVRKAAQAARLRSPLLFFEVLVDANEVHR